MEERIVTLENLVTLQDNTIAGLNTEVFRQQQDMAKLTRRIEVLEEKLQQVEQTERIAGQEKPPHW